MGNNKLQLAANDTMGIGMGMDDAAEEAVDPQEVWDTLGKIGEMLVEPWGQAAKNVWETVKGVLEPKGEPWVDSTGAGVMPGMSLDQTVSVTDLEEYYKRNISKFYDTVFDAKSIDALHDRYPEGWDDIDKMKEDLIELIGEEEYQDFVYSYYSNRKPTVSIYNAADGSLPTVDSQIIEAGVEYVLGSVAEEAGGYLAKSAGKEVLEYVVEGIPFVGDYL